MTITRRGLAGLAATIVAGPAVAQGRSKLTIAFGDPVSSLDPQLNNFAGDRSMDLHFFDLLVENKDNALQPGLASAWRQIDDLTWEFTIRPGVRWSDGKPFSADDVVYSLARAPSVPGSAASFAGFLRTVAAIDAPDPMRVVVRTKSPNPLLPLNLASIHIVSRHATEGVASADFNTGKALVGTGPYAMASYVPGDRTIMRAKPDYWGATPAWDDVDYRFIGAAPSRTAALLAGDVDVIDKVSVSDIDRLRARPDLGVFAYPGLRMLLLQPSFAPGPNRFITDAEGKPLAQNPLLDRRVRQALSVAVNRDALCERLMHGTANVTGQWMPAGTFGHDPGIPVPKFDPAATRRLLAEAGLPDGFNLTIHLPNDRYVMGPEVAQAVAQMWTRAGIRTQVEAVPWSVYASRVDKGEYAMTTLAWGNGTGEGSYALINVLGSRDPKQGRGVANWGDYRSDAVDAALEQAMQAFDDPAREAILQGSARVVTADVGIIPLFHYQNIWAARKGLVVRPMTSDRTVAMMVTRV